MKNRLMKFLKKYDIFSFSQFGFRENHFTTLAITYLCEYILKELDNKLNVCCSTFVDLAKAFDTINHNILLYKLKQYGVRGTAYNLIKSYLHNIKQLVQGDNVSSSLLNITIGFPQGSVLGPIFFLIYINDLTYSSDLDVTLYADDSVLSLAHKKVDLLQLLVNSELDKVNKWLQANQLLLNTDQTTSIFFLQKQQEDQFDK